MHLSTLFSTMAEKKAGDVETALPNNPTPSSVQMVRSSKRDAIVGGS